VDTEHSHTDLDEHQRAALAAYADGTLPARETSAVEAAIAQTPALRAAVDEQRRTIEAVRRADVPAPRALRDRVERARRRAAPAAQRRRRMFAAGTTAGLTGVALVLTLSLPGDVANGPTAVDAAELAQRPVGARAPVPEARRPRLLRLGAGGVPFPNWERVFGWRAIGSRTDRIGDRAVVTVFYERRGAKLGYSIVAGRRIPPPVATTDEVIEGVRFRSFVANGRRVVTWVRQDRTCVLSGRGVPFAELIRLASWKGGGPGSVPF